ncbi:recombinase family protein, partial [Enterococcus faecalis]
QIDISVLDMPLLDTASYKQLDGLETLISDLILQLLSYMAEDERKRINSRQREGVEAAKRKGVKFGRKKIALPPEFPAIYSDWKAGKITAVYAMDQLGMKRNTFYRRVKEYENTLHHFS